MRKKILIIFLIGIAIIWAQDPLRLENRLDPSIEYSLDNPQILNYGGTVNFYEFDVYASSSTNTNFLSSMIYLQYESAIFGDLNYNVNFFVALEENMTAHSNPPFGDPVNYYSPSGSFVDTGIISFGSNWNLPNAIGYYNYDNAVILTSEKQKILHVALMIPAGHEEDVMEVYLMEDPPGISYATYLDQQTYFTTPGTNDWTSYPEMSLIDMDYSVPAISEAELIAAIDEAGPYDVEVTGDFESGFGIELDWNEDYYYIDLGVATSTNVTLQDGYYEFYFSETPEGFEAYWAALGVTSTSTGPQAYIYQVITGEEPACYLKVENDGSKVYSLIDGLQTYMGLTDPVLRVNGSYPIGDYTFTGTVTSAYLIPGSIDIDVHVDGIPPEINAIDLVYTHAYPEWDLTAEGDLVSGYDITLVTFWDEYFLDMQNMQSNIPLEDGYYGFDVTTYPEDYFTYWDGRGVNASAVAGTWQAHMWQIINGNEPIFYLYNSGETQQLVDGLHHDFVGEELPALEIPGDYPGGVYTFTGTYTGINQEVSEPLVVTFNIESVDNIPPMATADAYETDEDTELVVEAPGVLVNDSDDGVPVAATLNLSSDVSHGELTLNADGSFTYMPDDDWFGEDSFSYYLDDTQLQSDVIDVTITVNSVDDFIVVNELLPTPGALEIDETETINFSISATDPDGNELDYTWSVDLEPVSSEATFDFVSDYSDFYGNYPAGNYVVSLRVSDNYASRNTINYTWTVLVNDVPYPPEFTEISLEAALDAAGPYDVAVGGDYASGYSIELDIYEEYYYLNLGATVSVPELAEGYHPFYFDGVSEYFFEYWAAKGVVEGAEGWQGIMWNIINSDAPIFYIKATPGSRDSGYSLIDGLLYQLYGTDNVLRLSGDYPIGDYTFTGDITSIHSEVSTINIDLHIDSNTPEINSLDLVYTNNLPNWDQNATGDLAAGYGITMITDYANYYLDLANLETNISLLNGYYGFYLETTPAGYIDYWAAKGVVEGATGWQGHMWEVINGNQPNLYLYYDEEGTHQLVDGLHHDLLGEEFPVLELPGDYPAGSYTFTGTFTGINHEESAELTIGLEVTSIFNATPVAIADAYETDEDTELVVETASGILANDTDDAIPAAAVMTMVDDVENGTLELNADGSFTYMPNENWFGEDSFTYYLADEFRQSDTVTVTITVNSVDDEIVVTELVPAEEPQIIDETDTINFSITASDPDGNELEYSWKLDDAVVSTTNTYDFVTDYLGDYDQGEYVVTLDVTDNYSARNAINYSWNVTVNNVNRIPVVEAMNVETDEDTPLEIILTGTDADLEDLTYTVTVEPENGVYAEGIYTPDYNWFGTDTFTYIANDGIDDSEPAVVTITVNSVDDEIVVTELLPAEEPQVIDETDTINFSITASDPDGNDLEYLWKLDDVQVSIVNTYDFVTDYLGDYDQGSYVVTLEVTDNYASRNTINYSWDITVNNVNRIPVVEAMNVETDEDTPLEIILTGTDEDLEELTYTVTVEPENGVYAEGIYTPDYNWFGTDTFTYLANDGIDNSLPAVVTITVNSVDDEIVVTELLPAEEPQVIDETDVINFSITASDPDGNDLEYLWKLDDMEVSTVNTYDFVTDYLGDYDQGEYVVTLDVTDNYSARNAINYSWNVTVNNVNRIPVVEAMNVETDEDIPLEIILTGTDADLEDLTYTVTVEPENGVYAENMYTPNEGWFGIDTFTYIANDGIDNSLSAVVTITVNSVDDFIVVDELLPAEGPQEIDETETINFSITASDPDGNELEYLWAVDGDEVSTVSTFDFVTDYSDYYGNYPAGVYAVTLNVTDNYTRNTLDYTWDVTVNDVPYPPEFTEISLVAALNEAGPYDVEVGGDYASGYSMELDIYEDYYYLNLGTAVSVPELAEGYQPIYFGEVSEYFFEYWAAKGVVEGAESWQGIMWDIINSDAPIFYIKATPESRETGYTLIDGLLYQLYGTDNVLRLSGDYPIGDYTFTGDISSIHSDVSTIDIDLHIDSNIPEISAIDLVYTNNLPNWDQIATGDLAMGYGITLYTYIDEYYLDMQNMDSNIPLLDGYNGFTLTTYPEDYMAYWDGRGVNALAEAGTWQAHMWQIINGNEPIFYLYNNGETQQLVDGLHHDFVGEELPELEIPGDYPGGDYTFEGSYVGINHEVSENLVISLNIESSDNMIPVAVEDSYAIDEDNELVVEAPGILANDGEDDEVPQAMTLVLAEDVAHGTLALNADGSFTYNPELNFFGEDQFTYYLDDTLLQSEIVAVVITVNSVDDEIVVTELLPAEELQVIDETETINFSITASDPDGNDLAYSWKVDDMEVSTVNTYDFVTDYLGDYDQGEYVVTLDVTDNYSARNAINYSWNVTVNNVNRIPVVEAMNVETDEDTPLEIILTGTDADLEDLTYTVTVEPENGVYAEGIYTPEENWFGTDEFTYIANDGIDDSEPAVVTITVNSVDDEIVVTELLPEEGPQVIDETDVINFSITASDPDGNDLEYSWKLDDMEVSTTNTYDFVTDYLGDYDQGDYVVTLEVTDNYGSRDTNNYTWNITVNNVNRIPVVEAMNVETDEDTPVEIILTGTDADLEDLTYSVTVEPEHGVYAEGLYTPEDNWFGEDTFTYVANDGIDDSESAVVTITVNSLDDEIVISELLPTTDTPEITEEESILFSVTADDADLYAPDDNVLVYSWKVDDMEVSTTSDYLFEGAYLGDHSAGEYAVTLDITDNYGSRSMYMHVWTLTVTNVNRIPVVEAMNVETDEDIPLEIVLTGTDADLEELTYTVTVEPENGVYAEGIYTPDYNWFGTDTFTYIANDGIDNSLPAVVTITVNSVDDEIVVTELLPAEEPQVIDETETINFSITASDPDGNDLEYSWKLDEMEVSTTNTYDFVTDYLGDYDQGEYVVTLEVTDNYGSRDTNNYTWNITVNNVNRIPVVEAVNVETEEDTPVEVILTGTDADLEDLTYIVTVEPENGVYTEGIYTPAEDWFGTDTFTYVANDGIDNSESAIVTVTVAPVNDAPQMNFPANLSFLEDEVLIEDLTPYLYDAEGDEITLSVTTGEDIHVTLDGFVATFSSDLNWFGQEDITFEADDQNGGVNVVDLTVIVEPVNDPPVFNSALQILGFDEDTVVDFDLSIYISDVDNEDLLLYASETEYVNVEINGYLVTLSSIEPHWNGQEYVTFYLDDQMGRTVVSDEVLIMVLPVNDAPIITFPTSINFDEDTVLNDDFNQYIVDVDGDEMILSAEGNDQIEVVITGMNVQFSAPENWFGSEEITFTADDQQTRESTTETVLVVVDPVNDAPVMNIPAITFDEDTVYEVDFTEYLSEIEGDPIILTSTVPEDIIISIDGMMVTFSAPWNWYGTEDVIFYADDSVGRAISEQTVLVTVNSVYDPVEIDLPESFTMDEDTVMEEDFTPYITNLDEMGLILYAEDYVNIDVAIDGLSVTFDPVDNWFGSEAITFYVDDQHGRTIATDVVTIEVISVNDAPVLTIPEIVFDEDNLSEIDFTPYIYDVEDDPVILTSALPEFIDIQIDGFMVTFSAPANWNGSEDVIFYADDSIVSELTEQLVTITINPVYDPVEMDIPETFSIVEDNILVEDFADYIVNIDNYELILMASDFDQIAVDIVDLMVTFTPAADWNGTENIMFSVNDQQGRTIIEDFVAVTVTPVNDDPVFDLPETFEFDEETQLMVDFSDYSFDADDDELLLISNADGFINVAIDGLNVTFSAPENWYGSEEITFTIDDQQGGTLAIDMVQVIVNNVNDAPVIDIPDNFSFDEDTILTEDFSVYITDNDPEDELLLFVDGAEEIVVVITGLNVEFSAPLNWNGSEAMLFSINDQQGRVIASDMTAVTVNPVNDAPVIELPGTFSFDEDTILEEDFAPYLSDVDNEILELSAEGNSDIIVIIDGYNVTFSAPLNWNGTENITFILDDMMGRLTASQEVIVTVDPIDDVTVVDIPETFEFNEDEQLIVDLAPYIIEVDGDELLLNTIGNFNISVEFNGLEAIFTATENWYGSENIIFTFDDQSGNPLVNDNALVTVLSVNDAPIIELPETFTFNEDESLIVDFTPYMSDVEGDTFTLDYIEPTEFVNVDISGFTVTFTAVENWYGNEEVTFTADDQVAETIGTDVVNIIVVPVNDIPVIDLPETFTFNEDESLVVDFSAYISDVDPDELILEVQDNSNILVAIDGLGVTFTALENWNGSEDLTFNVNDQSGRVIVSDIVTVIVEPVYDPVEMDIPETYVFEEDGMLEVNFGQYIINPDQLDLTLVAQDNENIYVEIVDLGVTFTAMENWFGTEDITFILDDGVTRTEVTDMVSVTVDPVNDAPEMMLPETIEFAEDTVLPVDFSEYISDVDNTNLYLEAQGNSEIVINIDDLMVTLSAPENWHGNEVVTFIVDDLVDRVTVSGDINVIVTPVNDEPVIELPETLEFAEDTMASLDLALYVSDVDVEDELVIDYSGNDMISVVLSGMLAEFSAPENWYGTETVTFTVDDQQGGIVSDDIDIIITPVNDNPVIDLPDSFEFNEDEMLMVDFSEFIIDVDPDLLVLEAQDNTNIYVDIDGLSVTFTALENWNGTEDITFTVDDQAGRAIATDIVAVTVLPVNDSPVINSYIPSENYINIDVESNVDFSLDAVDVDSEVTYSWYFNGELIEGVDVDNYSMLFNSNGIYDVSVYLTDGEYTLENTWTIDVYFGPVYEPVVYTGSTVVYGQVALNSFPVTNDDLVAAFVDGECRGLANAMYIEDGDYSLVNITVNGVIADEEITFHLYNWDADEEYILGDTYLSNPGGILGDPDRLQLNFTDGNGPNYIPVIYASYTEMIADIQINETPAPEGFVVYGFAADECRGAGVVDENGQVLMNIFGVTSEEISFLIWDNVADYTYSSYDTVVSEPGTTIGIDPVILITSEDLIYHTQTFEFASGWNYFSLNVVPDSYDVEDVFETLILDGKVRKIKNATQSFDPNLPPAYSSLKQLVPESGYFFDATEACTLEVYGYEVNLEHTPIALSYGWNFISYLPQGVIDVETALASVYEHLEMIKDVRTNYSPSVPSILNTLIELTPGMGYWIDVAADCTLVYPEASGRNTFTKKDFYFEPVVYTNSTVAYGYAELNKMPASGQIAAFVGEECRAVTNLKNGYFSLVIGGEDIETANFKIYSNGIIMETDASVVTNPGFSISDLRIEFTSGEIVPVTALSKIYPNPFNPVTNIQFSLSSEQIVNIDVYNVKGQKVANILNEVRPQGENHVSWSADNFASGIYYINFRTANTSENRKVILMK